MSKLLPYILFEEYIYILALERPDEGMGTVPVVSAHFRSLCSRRGGGARAVPPAQPDIYRVDQKKRTVFRLDNFVTVSPRKACSMSKFSEFFREKKVQNSHFSEFIYSLPNLLKSSKQLKLWYI